MRIAAKVDSNQKSITEALRRIGCSVQPIHVIGKGVPDLLVGRPCGGQRQNFLFEIKDGKKPPSQRKLTPDEIKWHDEWRGQVHIIESFEDALKIFDPC